MIYKINERTNRNYLNYHIDYYLKREINKFSKLKYNLINKKDDQNLGPDNLNKNIIDYLPYINKQSFINRNFHNNLSEKKNLEKNNLNKMKLFKNSIFDNNLKKKSKKNLLNLMNTNKNNEFNGVRNSDRIHKSISHKNMREKNKNKFEKQISVESIDSKFSKKSVKNIKIELDKELIENSKSYHKNNIINDFNDLEDIKERKIKKIKSEIKMKKEKDEEKIIDIIYIGNNVINNCKIKNQIIYDIRPLNKTKERSSCHFPKENNSKDSDNEDNENNEIKNIPNFKSNKNINTNYLTQNNLKYFKNSYSQVYSNDCDSNNNIQIKINEEENNMGNKKIENNEISEKELINKLNINKNDNNENIKKYKKNRKKIYGIQFYNNKKENQGKNNLEYIDLSVLAKEILDKKKDKNNLRSFFDKDENVVRGEKIKFLKTCYQVKVIKPILSQHTYKFKTLKNRTKKIFSPKKFKFPINHFNLDILKESNLKEINNTENHLLYLKNNISKCLNNLSDNLDEEMKNFH